MAFPIDFWIGGLRSYEPSPEKTVKLDQKRGHARSCFIYHARKPLRGSNKGAQRNYFFAATPRGNLTPVRTTPVQTQFTNMYDGAFTNGGIVPWVSPPDIKIGDWDAIVDPSATADRTRRKASAATVAPATIDAPAATAENRRTRKVRRVTRRAGSGQRAMAPVRQTGYRLGPL